MPIFTPTSATIDARLQFDALGFYLSDHPTSHLNLKTPIVSLMDPTVNITDVAVSGIVLSLFERDSTRNFSVRFELEDHSGRINCFVRDTLARHVWYTLRQSLNDHTIIAIHGRLTRGDYGLSIFVNKIDLAIDPLLLAELRGARVDGRLWSTLMQCSDESVYPTLFSLDPDVAVQYTKYLQGPVMTMRTKKSKGGWMEVLANEPTSLDLHVDTITELVRNVKKLYSQLKARCKKAGTTPPTLLDFAVSNPIFHDAVRLLSDGMTLRQRLVYVELAAYTLLHKGQK